MFSSLSTRVKSSGSNSVNYHEIFPAKNRVYPAIFQDNSTKVRGNFLPGIQYDRSDISGGKIKKKFLEFPLKFLLKIVHVNS